MPQIGPDEVRRFSEVAQQRYDEAMYLVSGGYNRGASYLAGYAVECILKALWLSKVQRTKWPAITEKFRGAKGHNLEWLRAEYLKRGGEAFPPAIAKAFTRLNSWNTDLRDKPGKMRFTETEDVLRAVDEIVVWARERL